MSETHERWTDRLSDYLDGGLSDDERAALEDHLAACGACRDVLGELRHVVQRAHALGPEVPARDLWPGIARAIGSASRERRARPGRDGEPRSNTRSKAGAMGLWLTVPQLAAAGLVLALGSASLTWWVGTNMRPGPVGASGGEPPLVAASRVAGPAPEAPERIARQLSALEDTLEAARKTLDPTSERIIRRNLDVIDRAIAESRRALAADPGDAFLKAHLDRTYERKVTYLREATRIVRGVSVP